MSLPLAYRPRIVLPDGRLEAAEGKDWSGLAEAVNLLCQRVKAEAG